MYIPVHGPHGRLLFKYDPDRQLIDIHVKNTGQVVIDLQRYQAPPPAANEPLVPPLAEPIQPDTQEGSHERSHNGGAIAHA
jgi:hypothetical protein